MLNYRAVWLGLCILAGSVAGCSRNAPVASKPGTVTGGNASTTETNEPGIHSTVDLNALLSLKEQSADEKYQVALLNSLNLLADRNYVEALDALKTAQMAKDSDEVRKQIDKVQGLILDQATFDEVVADIQAVIDLGQGEEAGQLVVKAMSLFEGNPESTRLASLKLQADALVAAKTTNVVKDIERLREEAVAAVKENNLRAALLAYEQALMLKSDVGLQTQSEALRTRLNKYDSALERASQLRRDPHTLDDAIAAYQEAAQVWDTLQVKQELADAQLALQLRRERIAVASFEVNGEGELVAYGTVFADGLLPHFKRRYDLVERGQVNRLLEELKVGADDLAMSEQGRADLSRLAKARYLVVGSISALSGVTVHARLVDLRSGLIVQTAKIGAPTAEEASRKLPQLAAMLMLSDEEKLSYERQIALAETAVVVNTNSTLPQVPQYDAKSQPAPINYSTGRPPAYGALLADEFDRLPSNSNSTDSLIQVSIEQERPLRLRLLAIQLELGDNLFRRGRHRDAVIRYQLARELDPANMDILTRIIMCQQYLPPMPEPLAAMPIRRDRIAFLNFFVSGDARMVPAELSTWTPENLIPYFSAAYEVIDRGEVYWMMNRLGLNLGDVLRDSSVRRWLGRSLGVRYLVVGRIQQTGSFTVTTSLLDAEQGWEIGRGQVIVRDVFELKLCLPELAHMTMLSQTERIRFEKETAVNQAEYLRAQEAFQRGQFSLALQIARKLRQLQPFNVRMSFFVNQCEEHARHEVLEQAKMKEHEHQRTLAEQAARQQAEFVLAVERARQKAYLGTAQLAEADRNRMRDQAHMQMLTQARIELSNNKFGVAIQLFEGALAFRPDDEKLLREAAQARSRMEENRRRSFFTEQQQREEAYRRQRVTELTASRQLWANDRQQFQSQLGLLKEQQLQDITEYSRLLDQAQRLKSQGRYDQAAAMLQAAKRIKPCDEVERLLADALVDQARAQAKAEDAAKFAELERKLAQETTRRKQAEQEVQRNWSLYQTAMQQAQEAQRNKNHQLAIGKYKEAMQLFRTGEVASKLQLCLAEIEKEKDRVELARRQTQEEERRAVEVTKYLAASKAAEQARKYDEALGSLRQAKALDPSNVEVLAALSRIEFARIKSIENQKTQMARDQAGRVKDYLAQAQKRTQARQYVAALALLDAAQKLVPGDQQVGSQIAAIKKLQASDAEAIVAAKKKEEDSRRQTTLRIQEEEKAKQLTGQAKQQAETALATGDLRAAESAIASAARLAPNDPALIKLKQDLTKAQGQATRLQVQADAKAQLEAEAQARQSNMNRENQGRIGQLIQQAQAAIAKKDFTGAEKLIGDALTLDPTNLAAGKAQRELQTARQAEAQVKAAMTAADKKKLDSETAKKKEDFTRLMKEGKEALASEDFEKATKLFNDAKTLNPDDADAALFLGMAKRDSERTKAEADLAKKEAEANKKREMEAAKAEADAKKKSEDELRRQLTMDAEAKKKADALKTLNKQQYTAAMTAGQQALDGKRYEEAIKAFEKASQLVPGDKDAIAQLTLARKLKADLTKSSVEKPSSTPEKASLAQLLAKATALQNQKKWDEALTVYRQALVVSPNDRAAKAGATLCEFQVNFETGRTALGKKEKDAAIKSLEAALKLTPGHAETQKLLKQARELK